MAVIISVPTLRYELEVGHESRSPFWSLSNKCRGGICCRILTFPSVVILSIFSSRYALQPLDPWALHSVGCAFVSLCSVCNIASAYWSGLGLYKLWIYCILAPYSKAG